METIIFDVDDTLYDQLQPFQKAFNKYFNHLHSFPIEQLYIASRKYSDKVFNSPMSQHEQQIYRITSACRDFGISISKDIAIQFQKTYEDEQQKIILFPEIHLLLEKLLQKNKQLAVLTNGPFEHQMKKVQQLQLTRWIPENNIFISGGIGHVKPSPLAFQFVEQKLCLQKQRTVYIGDSYENDIIGAKQVGWQAVWFNHRNKKQPNVPYLADQIITSPAALLKHLNENE
ncbi:HAD family hydrolase [Metasolibacillus sp. FSL H7-0170]|uniref:HAD family hydrolase n=1 Tax=Metasolibacillus sp. FSL H7-0170 TaxID=2921431 RepID=UPI003158097D